MKTIIAISIAAIAIATFAYAHCHTTAACEKVQEHMVLFYWDTPDGNTAKYYVNPDHPEKPSLTDDVNEAAGYWRNIEFLNVVVPFNPEYMDETEGFEPDEFDGLNVLGWKGILDKNGNPSDELAYTRQWTHDGTNELDEADIAFNYYQPLQAHATCQMNEYCLQATAAHEFGHFAGMDHVETVDGCVSHHSNYTMWEQQSIGSRSLEDLKCEDKWALHYTYTVLHPGD